MKVQAPFLQTVAIAATLTLAIIAPNAANAASITHKTASFSFDQDTFEDSFFSFGSVLPYFNAALGKLNSVTYQILGNSTASISITNNSNKKANAYGQTSTYGYGILSPQNRGWFYGYNQGASASIGGILSGKGATLTDTQTNNYLWWSSPSTLTDSYYLGLFTGTDNFAVDLYGYLGSYVSTTLSAYSVASAATGELSAMITYDYTPVPIPTPALLPGLLAMGVGIVRRRKAEAAAECEA